MNVRTTTICEQPLVPLRGLVNEQSWRVHPQYVRYLREFCSVVKLTEEEEEAKKFKMNAEIDRAEMNEKIRISKEKAIEAEKEVWANRLIIKNEKKLVEINSLKKNKIKGKIISQDSKGTRKLRSFPAAKNVPQKNLLQNNASQSNLPKDNIPEKNVPQKNVLPAKEEDEQGNNLTCCPPEWKRIARTHSVDVLT